MGFHPSGVAIYRGVWPQTLRDVLKACHALLHLVGYPVLYTPIPNELELISLLPEVESLCHKAVVFLIF